MKIYLKVIKFGIVSNIPPETICQELLHYSRPNLAHLGRLPEDTRILQTLPIKLLSQLEIPVLVFQESDVYDLQMAGCTGSGLFRNDTSRNVFVWIQTTDKDMYRMLRGRLPQPGFRLY